MVQDGLQEGADVTVTNLRILYKANNSITKLTTIRDIFEEPPAASGNNP
jgi:hypothetical protein